MGLPEGKISMILGPSGTGKSVCIKHMVGLLYPDEGDILVHGESVPNMPDDELFEMRKKFGVLFQDGALFGSMNLFDNVAFPLRQHTDKGEEEISEIVSRRLQEVGLGDANDKMPNELSGGMRKRAGFARALVLDPDIVLFDEPDSGLDPVRTALLCELIQEIHADDAGASGQAAAHAGLLLITHDIMTARRVAEYIAVLWRGRIVESGPPRSCSTPTTRSSASSSPVRPRGRWAWSDPAARTRMHIGVSLVNAAPESRSSACSRWRPSWSPSSCWAAAARTSTSSSSRPPASSSTTTSVQIGGRRVGSVKKIELTDDNRAEITVEVKEPYAPLHQGTTASSAAPRCPASPTATSR